MVVVPIANPETKPVEIPIVAIAVLLLAQVPPVTALLSAFVPPMQTDVMPVMAGGRGFTVTTLVVMQPVKNIL